MTKRTVISIMFVFVPALQMATAKPQTKAIAVIPRPVKMEVQDGNFTLSPRTVILVNKDTTSTGKYLSQLLAPATGFKLGVKKSSKPQEMSDCIILRTICDNNQLGPEGYELKVLKDRVIIQAPSPAGTFYACQTLRQLLPAAIESKNNIKDINWTIPLVNIEDKPRFQWRGLLMDCSRTFLDKDYLKTYIDLLALYKMNVLHLHLTDDQGWRIEMKKYKKLNSIGSKFPQRYYKKDGYYTRDDIKEIVRYAAERYITVVPEIEMPGHSLAALASYPELSCTGGPFEIYPFSRGPAIQENVFCAGNDKTFDFLEEVLTEVMDLFPSPYIHIGGDEVPKHKWKKCPKCQARIKTEGLKDEEELQGYFIRRIDKLLQSKGRRLIGWEEILKGGMPEGAILEPWRTRCAEIGIEAVNQGHDVIMALNTYCYLHRDYQPPKTDPNGKYLSLYKAYSFEPVLPQFPADKSKHVLGLEAAMWTNRDTDEDAIDNRVFPRLTALAEVGWSPKETRQFKDFRTRLKAHFKRLDRLGVHYYHGRAIWADAEEE